MLVLYNGFYLFEVGDGDVEFFTGWDRQGGVPPLRNGHKRNSIEDSSVIFSFIALVVLPLEEIGCFLEVTTLQWGLNTPCIVLDLFEVVDIILLEDIFKW